MSRFIFAALIICMSGCAHVRRDAHQTEISSTSRQVFCSATNSDRLNLRLTIDLKTTHLKEPPFHQQFEMPYFKIKDGGGASFRISLEILEWRKDRIVLAELMPTETADLFMLYVTSFERSNRFKRTSSSYLLLGLCRDAEMSISGDKNLHSLKARLELVDEPITKSP